MADLRIRIEEVDVEVDALEAAELYVGFQATLEVGNDQTVWRVTHFPVLELAVHLVRNEFALPFTFVSMNMEEEPSFASHRDNTAYRLVTHDGTEFATSEQELRAALEAFVGQVDGQLSEKVGWSVSEVVRRLDGL